MPNRCEGCNGQGYPGPLRANPSPCVLCAGTGRGHVHAWRLRQHRDFTIAARTCDGCGANQTAPKSSLAPAPKGYEAIWDAPWADERRGS